MYYSKALRPPRQVVLENNHEISKLFIFLPGVYDTHPQISISGTLHIVFYMVMLVLGNFVKFFL